MELAAIRYKDDLVERCKRNEPLAFRQLYDRYSRAMYNTCLRLLNNATAAEDVLQESFIEAFRHLDQFEYRTSFGGWLKQICINKCVNVLKKKQITWIAIDHVSDCTADDEGLDEQDIELKIGKVKRAMQQMPDGYRTVLSLYLFEGYDHEEMAKILKVAESTTRSQYIRAKQKLLKILNDHHG